MNKEEISVLAALVADQVVKKLKGVGNLAETEYVDTEEAARILPHMKAGNRKQGRIMFKRDALLNEFKQA